MREVRSIEFIRPSPCQPCAVLPHRTLSAVSKGVFWWPPNRTPDIITMATRQWTSGQQIRSLKAIFDTSAQLQHLKIHKYTPRRWREREKEKEIERERDRPNAIWFIRKSDKRRNTLLVCSSREIVFPLQMDIICGLSATVCVCVWAIRTHFYDFRPISSHSVCTFDQHSRTTTIHVCVLRASGLLNDNNECPHQTFGLLYINWFLVPSSAHSK